MLAWQRLNWFFAGKFGEKDRERERLHIREAHPSFAVLGSTDSREEEWSDITSTIASSIDQHHHHPLPPALPPASSIPHLQPHHHGLSDLPGIRIAEQGNTNSVGRLQTTHSNWGRLWKQKVTIIWMLKSTIDKLVTPNLPSLKYSSTLSSAV